MESLSHNPSSLTHLFCLLRSIWVKRTPEELVRQEFIAQLLQQGGYPLSSLVVEKSLNQLPHLQEASLKLPKRRFDLLAVAPVMGRSFSLIPLLLVECKAVKLTNTMLRQLEGYNLFIKAPAIALVNQEEIRFGVYQPSKNEYSFSSKILFYSSLKNLDFVTHS